MPTIWWQTLDIPEGVPGQVRLRSVNTAYDLFERRCERVEPLGRRRRTSKGSRAVVGMMLVGWVFPERRRLVLEPFWRSGGYAVFWREGTGSEQGRFAVTTPTVALEWLIVQRASQSPHTACGALHKA